MPYLPEYDSPELLEGVKNKTMKTETSFTRGPWIVRGSSKPMEIDSENGERITVWGAFIRPLSAKTRANAHLIAAAPDLYEALANILSLAEGNNTPDPAEIKQIATWASAALSKANP